MKVTFFAPQLPKDGISTYTNYLIGGLKEIGVETEIIPLQTEKKVKDYLKGVVEILNQRKLVHIQHEFTQWGDWRNPFNFLLRDFLRAIKTPKVLTVHSFHPWLVRFPSYRKKISTSEMIKRIVRMMLVLSPWGRYTFGKVFGGANKVIVHTYFHRNHLIKMGVPEASIAVIPHGVVRYQKKGEASRFREKYNLEGKIVLTIFGFWDPAKGYEIALEALKVLPDEFVLVIGGGPRTQAQEHYFRNLQFVPPKAEEISTKSLFSIVDFQQLEERVKITGFLPEDEIADLMAATDLVLVPQIYATGSGSLMHALGNHKVVVASDLPFFRELNQQEECLVLFRAGDSFDLAQKILELQKDLLKRKYLEGKVCEFVSRFNWIEVAKLHEVLYQSLL